MNGRPDAGVGTATAEISGHRRVDICVSWLVLLPEKGRRTHDLAGLAIPALRDVELNPRRLQRVGTCPGKTFNSRDLLLANGGHRGQATADRFAVDMNGAGTAHSHTTPELGSNEVEMVAQHPEHGGVGSDVYGAILAIDAEGVSTHALIRRRPGVIATRIRRQSASRTRHGSLAPRTSANGVTGR